MVFVRHGERLDQVGTLPPGHKIDFKFDPPLTDEGKKQAEKAADLTKQYLIQKGYGLDAKTTFITSPHIRTLQTCASFQYKLTETNQTKILVNGSIVVKQTEKMWT